MSPSRKPSRSLALSAGLRRDVELLEQLASPESIRRDGLGVLRLAGNLGREKSQVSRALRALENEGMVERDADTMEYRLGWRLYALAARTVEARLVQQAEPFLRRIVSALNETTHLCVLRHDEVLTVRSVFPSHAFRGLGWEGVGVPALTTSAGRILISDWPADTLRSWLEHHQPMDAGPGLRVRTIDDLLGEIADINRQGFATVDEEFAEGVVGVSAPAYDFRGRIVAAVNVSAPKGRLGSRLAEAGRLTVNVTRELSAALGYQPPATPGRVRR